MNGPKFYWNETKSKRLKRIRGLSIEELTAYPVLDLIDHPSRTGQVLVFFWAMEYVWVAPAVPERDGYFIKTIYPSRKHHQLYLERRKNEEKD